jgi:hypothetical protein
MPKLSALALVLVALIFLPSMLQTGTAAAQPSAAPTTGLIVPLYGQWGTEWEQLIQAKQAYPAVPVVAIVNAADGSGNARNPGYASAIDKLKAVGIVVLGYVWTLDGRRPIPSLEPDIVHWGAWYGVNGIYFDQMPQKAGMESYYAYMSQFTKSHGMTMTMGNPGANTSLSYVGTVSTVIISEQVGLPSLQYLASWDRPGYGKGSFAFIAEEVPDFNSTYAALASASVGLMFITDSSNYFVLPSYLSVEMSLLQSMAIPSQGVFGRPSMPVPE